MDRLMHIPNLGEARFPSPIARATTEHANVPAQIARMPGDATEEEMLFEMAGPRAKLFFNPEGTRAGIVTCGGLCPGLNDVIRSLFFELHHAYGVREVIGFRGGYQGLDPSRGQEPVEITSSMADGIHHLGGTVLGTSRGPVDIGVAVENLMQRRIDILFTVGGDGTQRGGNDLTQEAQKRGYALSVVGIPKTIDNDVAFVSRTFGFMTAIDMATRVLRCAHAEARSVQNGVALVKLMGRHAGFIAAGAAVASQDANFVLIPEVPFNLEGKRGLLAALKERLVRRGHAVVVVAEGAGQDLIKRETAGTDASGNVKLKDVGIWLRDKIEAWSKEEQFPIVMRYFDPSYLVRSSPANTEDSILCDLFARNAVHAAMAGKTGMVIGFLHEKFIHIPVQLLVSHTKRLDPTSPIWNAVLATTGQAERFE